MNFNFFLKLINRKNNVLKLFYNVLKNYKQKKKTSFSIFLLLLKQIITIFYFLCFTKNYSDYLNVKNFDYLQKFFFTNSFFIIKLYIVYIVRMHFFILFNNRKKNKNIDFAFIITNLAKSFNSCCIIFLSYILLYFYFINVYFLFLFFVPFSFLILLCDILFFAILHNACFKTNKNLIIIYFLFETIVLFFVLSFLNVTLGFFISLIVHCYLLYCLLKYFCIKNLFLTLQKIFCTVLIFNIDVLFFPKIIYESFYISYKLILSNYLLIRKLLYNIIYFLSTLKNINIHQKFFLFVLSKIFVFCCFYKINNFYTIDFFKKTLSFKENNNTNMLFLIYIHLDILLYGFSKIVLLSEKKNFFIETIFLPL